MTEDWVIHWNTRAERFIRKLGKGPITNRIREKINALTHRPNHGKYFPSHDVYALRIGTPGGEYRAIYQLISEDHVILIILIASRERVYKILGRLGLD